MKKSLSPRLAELESKISHCIDALQQHDTGPIQLWDCCCDHGFLGRNFISDTRLQTVNFVDSIPGIIDRLRAKLARIENALQGNYSKPSQLHPNLATYAISAADIDLQDNCTHIIVLAGIGGQTLIELYQAIFSKHENSNANIIFILCPNYHSYHVREQLLKQSFQLIDETFIEDNGKAHEIMVVTPHNQLPLTMQNVSVTGDFWQAGKPLQTKYLQRLLAHHQRRLDNNDDALDKQIIDAYRQVEHLLEE